MRCQRIGREPTGTIGFGMSSVYSRSRSPSPPQNRTTFMPARPLSAGAPGPARSIPLGWTAERPRAAPAASAPSIRPGPGRRRSLAQAPPQDRPEPRRQRDGEPPPGRNRGARQGSRPVRTGGFGGDPGGPRRHVGGRARGRGTAPRRGPDDRAALPVERLHGRTPLPLEAVRAAPGRGPPEVEPDEALLARPANRLPVEERARTRPALRPEGRGPRHEERVPEGETEAARDRAAGPPDDREPGAVAELLQDRAEEAAPVDGRPQVPHVPREHPVE